MGMQVNPGGTFESRADSGSSGWDTGAEGNIEMSDSR